MPKRRFSEDATAARAEGRPAAGVYPWSSSGEQVASERSIEARTASGAGTDGLPKLKSNTFSAPTCALRSHAYEKISRITELSAPRSNMV